MSSENTNTFTKENLNTYLSELGKQYRKLCGKAVEAEIILVGGAAGAFASVDPVNQITIYYAQHVLLSPNNSLRAWIYHAVRADLFGEKGDIPNVELNYDPRITY